MNKESLPTLTAERELSCICHQLPAAPVDSSSQLWLHCGRCAPWRAHGSTAWAPPPGPACTLHRTAKNGATPDARTKADRATVDTVLDPRTWTILGKLRNAEAFAELHGCISTGKEANVYAATGQDGAQLAVKIYKTSILVFKDRDRCAAGSV